MISYRVKSRGPNREFLPMKNYRLKLARYLAISLGIRLRPHALGLNTEGAKAFLDAWTAEIDKWLSEYQTANGVQISVIENSGFSDEGRR